MPRLYCRGVPWALTLYRSVSRAGRIIACRFGWHSLVAAYGLPPEKVLYIPHGIDVPQGPATARSQRELLQHVGMRFLLSAGAGSTEGKSQYWPKALLGAKMVQGAWQNTIPGLGRVCHNANWTFHMG